MYACSYLGRFLKYFVVGQSTLTTLSPGISCLYNSSFKFFVVLQAVIMLYCSTVLYLAETVFGIITFSSPSGRLFSRRGSVQTAHALHNIRGESILHNILKTVLCCLHVYQVACKILANSSYNSSSGRAVVLLAPHISSIEFHADCRLVSCPRVTSYHRCCTSRDPPIRR